MDDSRADEKVAMLQGEIDNLNHKIAFLEGKLKELESNRSVPRSPWDVIGPGLSQPNDVKSCVKCGINPKGSWSYCCPDAECPMGMGPISSKVS